MDPVLLASQGFNVAGMTIPWGVLAFVAIVVIGLLLIRAAITLVKVAILVGIGIAVWLGIQFIIGLFS